MICVNYLRYHLKFDPKPLAKKAYIHTHEQHINRNNNYYKTRNIKYLKQKYILVTKQYKAQKHENTNLHDI